MMHGQTRLNTNCPIMPHSGSGIPTTTHAISSDCYRVAAGYAQRDAAAAVNIPSLPAVQLLCMSSHSLHTTNNSPANSRSKICDQKRKAALFLANGERKAQLAGQPRAVDNMPRLFRDPYNTRNGLCYSAPAGYAQRDAAAAVHISLYLLCTTRLHICVSAHSLYTTTNSPAFINSDPKKEGSSFLGKRRHHRAGNTCRSTSGSCTGNVPIRQVLSKALGITAVCSHGAPPFINKVCHE